MQEGFLDERIPPAKLGRINRSQSNEVPRVQGKRRMTFEAKTRATLKVKEHDVFVELEVDQCGSSFREVRNGTGKNLDYRVLVARNHRFIYAYIKRSCFMREWVLLSLSYHSHRVSNFFCEWLDSKYFRLCGSHTVSLFITL